MPRTNTPPLKPLKHKPAEPAFGLSATEIALIRSLCEGRTIEGASAHIGISLAMGQQHMRYMKHKMKCFHLSCMVLLAERAGLLDGVLGNTTTEALRWQPTGMPDADENVLITMITADGPEVWPGYWSGAQWLALDGMPIRWTVVSWTKWPEGYAPKPRAA
jgi:hypothetical protein